MRWLLCTLIFVVLCNVGEATEIDDCRALLLSGKYQECLETATAAIEKGVYGEAWHQVKAEAEFRLGKYEDSLETTQVALKKYNWSIRLRWAAMKVCRYVDQGELRETYAEEIGKLVQSTPWRYTDVENLIVLGEFSLDAGADAKDVQEAFFQRARRNNPQHRLPVLALGNLALDKRDFELAAELFRPAAERLPDDADIQFGLAESIRSVAPEGATTALRTSLELNPNHERAILSQVDRLIDGEKYKEAMSSARILLDINPKHPEALAFRSVIEELQGDEEAAGKSREAALATWGKNPLVDHVIGRKLSQKYRFETGAKHQQQALTFDPEYLPAKKQLSQDLLRMGREAEGWELADEVYQRDQYDVAIYNLVTLRDVLEKFTTLNENGFTIRMDAHEADVYGSRVVLLLTEAREVLCEKYQLELPENILVEIFPEPDDFAVRTFGMPGAEGYLGVCFGDVITANSPASQENNPTNWQAVLWHEFAHVVTLNKTNNRMPRWLSEGISVYEERQRDPSWGEQLNQPYREMILSGELTPVENLSEAFLSPSSSQHLMFAYYESSLVVEYLIDEYGFETLLKILDDLGAGMFINEALARHTVPIAQLDDEFQAHVIKTAREFGKEVDWSPPDLAGVTNSKLPVVEAISWVALHPNNYVGVKTCAAFLIKNDVPDTAIELLEQLLELYPHELGPKSATMMLADLYRQSGQLDKEESLLKDYAERDDDAAAVLARLIEHAEAKQDWKSVQLYGKKLVAVKPLILTPHKSLAIAGENLEDHQLATEALETQLLLDAPDVADVRFRLAKQYQHLGQTEVAKRNVLQALEVAPRFRDALALLLELQ